jgi:Ssp1 endopeptidase immunity protein Rap1a
MIQPGCEAVINRTRPPDLVAAASLGHCEGTVSTVLLLASSLKEPASICRPKDATIAQAIRVVLAYLNKNPQRLHDLFSVLTVDALREAWPCSSAK